MTSRSATGTTTTSLCRRLLFLPPLLLLLLVPAAESIQPAVPSYSSSRKLRVAVVVVTSPRRSHFHERIYRCYLYQTLRPAQLVVVDDPDGKPSNFFLSQRIQEGDKTVTYVRTKKKLSVGAKRNFAISLAKRMDVIAIFDDDDVYAPRYIERMVEAMRKFKVDFVKLASWHWYNVEKGLLGRWEPIQSRCNNFVWGFGFSYVFKRAVWEQTKYPDRDFGEDFEFLTGVRGTENLKILALETPRFGLGDAMTIHVKHGDNLSKVFASAVLVKSSEELGSLFAEQCSYLSGKSERRTACRRYFGSIGMTIYRNSEVLRDIQPFPKAHELSRDRCNGNFWISEADVCWVGALSGLGSKKPASPVPNIPRIIVFSSNEKLLNASKFQKLSREGKRDRRIVRKTLKLNKGWTVRYYLDKDCADLIRSLSPPIDGLMDAFIGVKRGAYRADICRLLALYVHGGVYQDVNMPSRIGIDEWLQPQTTFASAFSVCPARGDFFNSILAATPGHPALRLALEMIGREFNPNHTSQNENLHGFPRFADYYEWPRFNRIEEKPFCAFQLGTVMTFLAWEEFEKAGNLWRKGHASQMLSETPHFKGLFPSVRRRHVQFEDENELWTMCNMLIIDHYSMQVPYYSHPVGRKIDRRIPNADPMGLGHCRWEDRLSAI
eukprot:CAMPEP_0114500520 /NCGR_PEP_ID=MMETSP0109-20121206/8008_1 /TAXON_ID=29199 /ORGANISM="Chlorarachnion reptans, Strain CCCM449" /LENGTH=662 /DNA_ID=CAMNT_0001678187 /DNA_START=105 /DNA_END=2093 /DNA_ORIENTATION=+